MHNRSLSTDFNVSLNDALKQIEEALLSFSYQNALNLCEKNEKLVEIELNSFSQRLNFYDINYETAETYHNLSIWKKKFIYNKATIYAKLKNINEVTKTLFALADVSNYVERAEIMLKYCELLHAEKLLPTEELLTASKEFQKNIIKYIFFVDEIDITKILQQYLHLTALQIRMALEDNNLKHAILYLMKALTTLRNANSSLTYFDDRTWAVTENEFADHSAWQCAKNFYDYWLEIFDKPEISDMQVVISILHQNLAICELKLGFPGAALKHYQALHQFTGDSSLFEPMLKCSIASKEWKQASRYYPVVFGNKFPKNPIMLITIKLGLDKIEKACLVHKDAMIHFNKRIAKSVSVEDHGQLMQILRDNEFTENVHDPELSQNLFDYYKFYYSQPILCEKYGNWGWPESELISLDADDVLFIKATILTALIEKNTSYEINEVKLRELFQGVRILWDDHKKTQPENKLLAKLYRGIEKHFQNLQFRSQLFISSQQLEKVAAPKKDTLAVRFTG